MSMKDLASRAVASPHWRWMPGMLTEHGNRYVAEGRYPRRSVLPDLSDPATLGCLLALVREAWEGRFTVCGEAQLTPQALVAALEAAP